MWSIPAQLLFTGIDGISLKHELSTVSLTQFMHSFKSRHDTDSNPDYPVLPRFFVRKKAVLQATTGLVSYTGARAASGEGAARDVDAHCNPYVDVAEYGINRHDLLSDFFKYFSISFTS